MTTLRVRTDNNDLPHFLTFTVRNWYYILDRYSRFNILSSSLQYAQNYKSLQVFAYVFMLNHLHLIVASPDLIGFIRDFKSFTSKEMSKNICAFEPHILKLFQTPNGFQFWQETNEPKTIETQNFMNQKVDYIQDNPVRKQYVVKPEYWRWSSANPRSEIEVSAIEEIQNPQARTLEGAREFVQIKQKLKTLLL